MVCRTHLVCRDLLNDEHNSAPREFYTIHFVLGASVRGFLDISSSFWRLKRAFLFPNTSHKIQEISQLIFSDHITYETPVTILKLKALLVGHCSYSCATIGPCPTMQRDWLQICSFVPIPESSKRLCGWLTVKRWRIVGQSSISTTAVLRDQCFLDRGLHHSDVFWKALGVNL